MTSLELAGKNALVCGGSQGIGAAAARELAARGARVTILSRSPGDSPFMKLTADLGNIETLIPTLADQLGHAVEFDILVNNSGGPPPGKIVDATPEQFLATFRQHLLSAHLLAQWVLPGMKSRKFGRIVNVISTSVREPLEGLGVSNTIRAAVAAWAKTLSREVAPFAITVNNVLPGATRTERLEQIVKRKSEASGTSLDEVADHMKSEIPLGRFGEPEEIGAVIAFLASPKAGYLTGASIPVDGGRLRSV